MASRSPSARCEHAVVRQEIGALADRSDDLPDRRRAGARRDRAHLVPGVVQRGPQQVVHRRVDDREIALRARLQVDHARKQRPALPTSIAAGLEQQLERARRRAERGSLRRNRPAAIGLLVAVADADAAAEVDVLERDAVGAQPVDQRRTPWRRPRNAAPASVICEPMCMSMPRTATCGSPAARRYSGSAS